MLARTRGALFFAALWLMPSSALACSMRFVDVFDQAERAQTVALGRVVPGGLQIDELLRGPARRAVRVLAGGGSCRVPMRRGQRALVFVGADHRLVAHHQSFIERPTPALTDAVRRWTSADDDDARRALLVELTLGTGPAARHAAHHLADRPDLLAGLSATQQADLIRSIRTVDASRVQGLAMIAARLHLIAAVEPLLSRLEHVRYVEEVGIPLEILANHRQPTPGSDDTNPAARWHHWRMNLGRRALAGVILEEDVPTPVALVRAHWASWLTAHGEMSPEALFRAGFLERSVTAPDPSDRDALADLARNGPDTLSRVAAFERCERLHARHLASVHGYSRGSSPQYWVTLAESCATGMLPPY